MGSWTGTESQAGFVIERRGVGHRQRWVLKPRRHDGSYGRVIFEDYRRSMVEQAKRAADSMLAAGDEWAVALVDVSAGQLR
jgi:hypothetical protein